MINLQEPKIPVASNPVEIDAVILDLQTKIETNLSWISHAYGRSYRHFEYKGSQIVFYPEVYKGVTNNKPSYFKTKPDNDKKGQCYFVVSEEEVLDFKRNVYNYISWNVGLVFMVNLKLIDDLSLQTELITQNLIQEVRSLLTRGLIGGFYSVTIKSVERDFRNIFKEFSHQEKENYIKAPLQAFRFNLNVVYQENCVDFSFSRQKALKNNIMKDEKRMLFQDIDFSLPDSLEILTDVQKQQLKAIL